MYSRIILTAATSLLFTFQSVAAQTGPLNGRNRRPVMENGQSAPDLERPVTITPVRAGQKDQAKADASSRIFYLKNALAKEVAAAVAELFSDADSNLKVKADPRTNAVIVNTVPRQVPTGLFALRGRLFSQIEQVVEQLDKAATSKVAIVKVFTLQHVPAKDAAEVVEKIFDGSTGFRVSTDARINGVVAAGTDEQLKILEQVLLRVDVAQSAKKSDGRITQFVPVKGFDRAMEKVVGLTSRELDVELIHDEARGFVVLRGNRKDIDEVTKAIDAVEQISAAAARQKADVEKQVEPTGSLRVIWLMTGGANGKELPKDLRQVADSLSKVGVTDLRLVAQMMVNVSGNSNFSLQGTTNGSQIEISGDREGQVGKQTVFALQIEAVGLQTRDGKQGPSASVATNVQLSDGQLVVLGVAPSEDAQSVFVVQLVK